MADLVEKELSYKIVGILYDVYNSLGGGYQEKYYQKAIAKELRENRLAYREQLLVPLSYKNESIGRYFLDFLVEDKIVLEIKSAPKFYARDIKQILSYLNKTGICLGILANFNKKDVQIKRVLRGFPIRDN